MSAHLDRLRLRAQEATATREAAEQVLAAAMREFEPTFIGPVPAAVLAKKWEARAEDWRNRAFCSAWGAYMRARRLESRAKSAAHRARFEFMPAAGPSIAAKPLTPSEVHQELTERRLAT